VPRGLSCWEFVGDLSFRSLVEFIKESGYGHRCPCVAQNLSVRNNGRLGIISSLRKLWYKRVQFPSGLFFFHSNYASLEIETSLAPILITALFLHLANILNIIPWPELHIYNRPALATAMLTCGNIVGIFNLTISKTHTGELVIRWLSPPKPNKRHQSVLADWFDRVGDLLLESRDLPEWKASESEADKAVLICSGTREWEAKFGVKGAINWKKEIPLTIRKTSSLVIDNLSD